MIIAGKRAAEDRAYSDNLQLLEVRIEQALTCLREAFIKKKKKKMTFVISGLTPPPPPPKMTNYFLFFFLVLDHIWVTFGKKIFFAP